VGSRPPRFHHRRVQAVAADELLEQSLKLGPEPRVHPGGIVQSRQLVQGGDEGPGPVDPGPVGFGPDRARRIGGTRISPSSVRGTFDSSGPPAVDRHAVRQIPAVLAKADYEIRRMPKGDMDS
jgi:hypothetical protein